MPSYFWLQHLKQTTVSVRLCCKSLVLVRYLFIYFKRKHGSQSCQVHRSYASSFFGLLKIFHKCSRQAEAWITLILSSLGDVSEVTVFPQWSDIWMESLFKAVNYSSGSVVTPPVSLPVVCRGTAGTSAERFCAEHVDLQCKPTEGEWSSQFFSVVTQTFLTIGQ